MTAGSTNLYGRYDVLIIGGGVIGLSIARELSRRGVRRIAVADRGTVGTEASHAAAGMLVPNAEAERDDSFYRFCVESFELYDAFAAELLEQTGVDVELDREGTLYLAFDERAASEIGRRFDWQSRLGTLVERVSTNDILALEPQVSPDVIEGLFFPNDWHVESRKLLAALRAYAETSNISLLENCRLDSITTAGGSVSGAVGSGVRLLSDNVVLATGAWSSLINIGGVALPIAVRPVKGQMICFRREPQFLRKIIFGPNGYLVPRADGRILAGATVEDAGFNKDVTGEAIERLQAAAFQMAPAIGRLPISESWAGLRPAAPDGLPVLGTIDGLSGLHIATAHYRNGILLAPLTARIIASSICGERTSPYLEEFGPRRFARVAAPGAV